jgi:hypothetical protein
VRVEIVALLLTFALVGLVVIAAIVVGIVLIVRASKPSAAQAYPQQTPALNAPVGWYPDPQHPNFMRYFDGQAWTSSTQPRS